MQSGKVLSIYLQVHIIINVDDLYDEFCDYKTHMKTSVMTPGMRQKL